MHFQDHLHKLGKCVLEASFPAHRLSQLHGYKCTQCYLSKSKGHSSKETDALELSGRITACCIFSLHKYNSEIITKITNTQKIKRNQLHICKQATTTAIWIVLSGERLIFPYGLSWAVHRLWSKFYIWATSSHLFTMQMGRTQSCAKSLSPSPSCPHPVPCQESSEHFLFISTFPLHCEADK